LNNRKSTRYFTLALFMVVFAFSACPNPGDSAADDHVYIAGVYADAACYWKNKTRIDMAEGFVSDIVVISR